MRYGNGGSNIEIGKARFHHDGVITEIKQINFGAGGQNVRVFNSAVELSGFTEYEEIYSDYFTPSLTNNSDVNNFAISAAESTGNYNAEGNIGYAVKLPYHISVTKGQQLLRIKGPVTFSQQSYSNNTCSAICAVAITEYSYPTHTRTFSFVSFNASASVDTVISSSVDYAIGDNDEIYLILYISIDLTGSDHDVGGSISIPWSAFEWIPTGESFEYQ